MEGGKNYQSSLSGAELSEIQHEIKQLIEEKDHNKLIDSIPRIANLVTSVLERVKDIYQVYPALQIVSEFLTLAPKKVP